MLAEDKFCKLLLHKNLSSSIVLHCTDSVGVAKLLIEQPRRQNDNQLLSVCREQLVSKGGSGFTAKEAVMDREEEFTDRELLAYLESYESLTVSSPGAPISVSSNMATKKRKLNMHVAVKLNPLLNGFQQSVAQEAFDLIMETTEYPDSIVHAVLGYLSPLDVMKRARNNLI